MPAGVATQTGGITGASQKAGKTMNKQKAIEAAIRWLLRESGEIFSVKFACEITDAGDGAYYEIDLANPAYLTIEDVAMHFVTICENSIIDGERWIKVWLKESGILFIWPDHASLISYYGEPVIRICYEDVEKEGADVIKCLSADEARALRAPMNEAQKALLEEACKDGYITEAQIEEFMKSYERAHRRPGIIDTLPEVCKTKKEEEKQ
jgi:hypothetical protein